MNPFLPEHLYVVQEVRWEFVQGEVIRRFRCPDAERGEVVMSFPDRDLAENYCAELEREKRAEVNPFEYCESIEELTPFDADRWHDWILDAGLEPPPPNRPVRRDDWVEWWDAQAPAMTELQRAKIWQALDKLRFFFVVELFASESW